MKKLVCGICFSLFAQASIAGDWSGPSTVGEINSGYAEGLILFKTIKSHNNPKGCDPAYYAVREGDAAVDVILSMLLAAQRSGSEIRVGVNSTKCDAGGRISVSRIKSLP